MGKYLHMPVCLFVCVCLFLSVSVCVCVCVCVTGKSCRIYAGYMTNKKTKSD